MKKPVCIVVQVWEKSNVPRHEKYPIWNTQFKLTKPEIQELPFQIKRFPGAGHYNEKRVPDLLLYWHSPGKFSLMVIDDPTLTMKTLKHKDYFDKKISQYRKRWRKGRKTVCEGACVMPSKKTAVLNNEERRKESKKCHRKQSEETCTSPCTWVQGPCSYLEDKELGFTRGVSMYYVMVDDPRKKQAVKRRLHEVYSRGYPLRYFGFSYHCGSQQPTLDIAYYMYKHGFPAREEFGMETVFDDRKEAAEVRKKMKELETINAMYDRLSKHSTRVPKKVPKNLQNQTKKGNTIGILKNNKLVFAGSFAAAHAWLKAGQKPMDVSQWKVAPVEELGKLCEKKHTAQCNKLARAMPAGLKLRVVHPILRGGMRGMKKYVRRVEAVHGRRNDLRRVANQLILPTR